MEGISEMPISQHWIDPDLAVVGRLQEFILIWRPSLTVLNVTV